jgi:hypothetical protein
MSLHLDVVCEPHVSMEERKSQTVRAIAEVLPFVLAKYGVNALSARCSGASSSGDESAWKGSSPRFRIR